MSVLPARVGLLATGVLCLVIALTTRTRASSVSPLTSASVDVQPVIARQGATFETSVVPRPDEDVAEACRYEITLMNPSQRIKGVWVMFERSLDVRRYYQDADVRAFARRHDLALLFPFHCRSKSETGGDMNVDPRRGLGRALFAGLTQLAEGSGHPELASAKLILLGFSGTGSLVGRLAGYAPERMLAVIPTDPGHFDPLGMDTITLSPKAAAIPQLILAGSADAVSGTERPYAYFRRHFDQGAPWTFVVQNQAPHCCIMNAKALILEWLDAVVVREDYPHHGAVRLHRDPADRRHGLSGSDASGSFVLVPQLQGHMGRRHLVGTRATIDRRQHPPQGMMPAGWLPTGAFAERWRAFVTRPEHPVTMPP